MQTTRIFLAQPTVGDGPEPQTIVIEDMIPSTKDLGVAVDTYAQQGDLLESTLYKSLPGGTYDAVLRLMLERRASMLRVTFEG